ncbi:unnamed protein product [Meloidogyne enterolobii]|uniref:Uncharacterized protein n=1 Tax=Meloidogyne enterolobii TaxID=390850 RepID=A0ACB0ZQS2_MELEN
MLRICVPSCPLSPPAPSCSSTFFKYFFIILPIPASCAARMFVHTENTLNIPFTPSNLFF